MYTSMLLLLLFGAALGQTTTATEPADQKSPAAVKDVSCLTPEQEPGTCVRYYLCNDTIDDSISEIDIHLPYNPCSDFLDVCCQNPIPPESMFPKEKREGCGWSNPRNKDILMAPYPDNEANFGEFPWVVALMNVESDNDKGQYIGSGSLIHRRVVLTTAHTIANANKLRVRAGEWDTQSESEIYPHQDRDVESVVVHKDYINKTLFYDIALLFLSKPVDLAPHIGIACLPPLKLKADAGTECYTTGWGKDKYGRESLSRVVLKKRKLPVIGHRDCRDLLRKTRLKNQFELHHTFMCAGGEGGDTCMGDGGSPLVCPIESQKDRYVQNGMTAWGLGCREENPVAFVDVSVLRDWIDNEVLGKGIEDLEYAKY